MSGWRPALRIARRGVRRSAGRSALIAALVAVPVAGATLADVLARTLSAPGREAQRAMGSADALLRVTPYARLQLPAGSPWDYRPPAGADPERDAGRVDAAALVPAGTRLVPQPVASEVRLERGDRIVRTMVTTADPREPLHRHEVRVASGRAPTAPDEALVTRKLGERLGLLDGDGRLRTGAAVRAVDGATAAVTGVARMPFCLDCEQLFANAGSALYRSGTHQSHGQEERVYLADLPRGASADALLAPLAARGVAVIPRGATLDPDRYGGAPGGPQVSSDDLRAAGLVAVIVGIGLLEVVLLAGTAFAVGARRQTRALGLVAAAGGSARDVRRIVLAQGLVLGALGAAAGVAAGFALAFGLEPIWENLDDAEITSWTFGPLEVGGAALVGVLSGLAAALVPAIGAGRMRPVDALSGRFRALGGARGRRGPLAGLALIGAGAACGLAGDRLLAGDFAAYTRVLATVQETGAQVSAPSPTGPLALILGGATIAIAGLVLLAPALIGRLARAGARLPVSVRLAVRDAARHRHRTGPATSAIAVAVAGSVVLALLLAGRFHADDLQRVPAVPPGVMGVDAAESGAAARGAALAAAELPDARVHEVRVPIRPLEPGEEVPDDMHVAQARAMWVRDVAADCDPAGECPAVNAGTGQLAIAADRASDGVVAGAPLDAAARAALAAGRVLVFNRRHLDAKGMVIVEVGWDERRDVPREARLPGHLAARDVAYTGLPSALVPRSVARSRGWEIAEAGALVSYSTAATPDDVDTAIAAAEGAGVFAYIELGPEAADDAILLIVAAIAAFVTLVGVAISVALSAAEGRGDLATLAAVGADPRRRRALAGSQALLIAGLGCALGVALGVFVAFTARATTGSPDFVIPWANLAVTGVAVPLLAVLVAALFTPGRLPLVRRAE